ncbi:MAG: hypothetical protein Q7K57_59615 [Burkholderiaceae bacterium]|nr:hypothetical protein [Burkholderiaceae bacterium]
MAVREMRATVLGASLMSAAASLPLHLLPILVLALSQGGRTSTAHAGWVASAYMVGQLCSVLLLPSLGVQRVVRAGALLAVSVMVGSTVLSSSPSQFLLLLSWLVIGLACGSLHFLATTTAAAANDRRMAFAVRMAMSSAVGGAVIVVLQLARRQVDYATLSTLLAAAFALIAGLGLFLYRTPPLISHTAIAAGGADPPASAVTRAGFLALFVLFVGQHGLWAFALQGAQQRGLALEQVMWAIALCKFAGAAFVLGSGRGWGQSEARPSVLLPALAVAGGGLVVVLSTQAGMFWVGLLFWEIGLNLLSARLQALVAQQDPRRAGMWMTSAIFLGAASGPALAGWAIGMGQFHLFALFGAATGLVPYIWTLALPHPANCAATPKKC